MYYIQYLTSEYISIYLIAGIIWNIDLFNLFVITT